MLVLLARGHDAEAIEVIRKIAHFNKAPKPRLALADFRALDAEYNNETLPEAHENTARTFNRVLKQSLGRLQPSWLLA